MMLLMLKHVRCVHLFIGLLKLDVHHRTHQELYSDAETHAYTDTQIHYHVLKKAYRSGADCNSCCPEFYSKSVVIKSL